MLLFDRRRVQGLGLRFQDWGLVGVWGCDVGLRGLSKSVTS